MIRRATLADLDFLIGVAKDVYPPFDEDVARAYIDANIGKTSQLWVRGEYGAGVIVSHKPFYATEIRASLLWLAARPNRTMEGYRILCYLLEQARAAGAHTLRFGEETGMRFDILAKRLGAKASETYEVRLV